MHLAYFIFWIYTVKICLKQNIWLPLRFLYIDIKDFQVSVWDLWLPQMMVPSRSEHSYIERKHRKKSSTYYPLLQLYTLRGAKTLALNIKKRIFSQAKTICHLLKAYKRFNVNYVFNKLLYIVKKCFFLFWECFS